MLQKRHAWYHDGRLWTLVAGNLFAMSMAVVQEWDVAQVFWVFWCESVAIGVSYLLEGIFGSAPTPSFGVLDRVGRFLENLGSAFVFMLFYGGFHLAYALVLMEWGFAVPTFREEPETVLVIAVLCATPILGYVLRRARVRVREEAGLGPIERIVPMHLGLVLGAAAGGSGMIVVMMFMKAMFEIGTHLWKIRVPSKV